VTAFVYLAGLLLLTLAVVLLNAGWWSSYAMVFVGGMLTFVPVAGWVGR
jgi:hypothetical protein